ncbi:MAG: hypothetical protein JNL12_21965, partial [Planctomycetes bacterium]|nr:hypothetical protein [Planctomycetota bacterium]
MVRHSLVAGAFVRSVLVVLAVGGGLAAQRPAEAASQSGNNPPANARRLQVLFLGAPTRNGPHHDPITRYATLKKGLGTAGIDL